MDIKLEIVKLHTKMEKQCLSGDKISRQVDTISNHNFY